MEEKNFNVIKTEEQFLSNYNLHDLAKKAGEEILKAKCYSTEIFGEDRRHENLWEAGQDKPDCFIIDKNKNRICLLDWKGKKSKGYRLNKRAFNSYLKISIQTKLQILAAMAFFDDNKNIIEFSFFNLNETGIIMKENCEWDKNITVILNPELRRDFYKIDEYLISLQQVQPKS